MQNAFLDIQDLPKFSMFHVEQIESAVDQVLTENREKINQLATEETAPTWKNFVAKLEVLENRFQKVWGPIGHLDSVSNSDEWHQAYNQCLEKVTEYYTGLGQHEGLFTKFKMLSESDEYSQLSVSKQKVINEALKQFKLSGIDLPSDKKQQFQEISQQLSKLQSKFSNNVLKSTQAWEKLIEDEEVLVGLPEFSLDLLAQLAAQKDRNGWRITLDFPSYHAVMTYADNRNLREEVYKAFATRSSELATDPQYDNSELIKQIMLLRSQKADLLDYNNFAELSLAKKMADTPQQIMEFLRDLARESKPQALQELQTLKTFAAEEVGLDDLKSWDINYVSEKLKQKTLSLSNEVLKPYFPVSKVLKGLFKITQTIFATKIEEVAGIDCWHPDVRYFQLTNISDQEVIGGFYLDLYAREHKRGGAWMDTVMHRWLSENNTLQNPVAYLVCNFTPPVGNKEALLTHDEVTTLFHEFGHGIHHMMTKQIDLDVSGIAGVPWDAVELPSQFMENFCWEKAGLDLMTGHIETGETLPEGLLVSLKKSRGFQSAMMMLRQIEFGLFDMELHSKYQADNSIDILALIKELRNEISVVFPPDYNRFSHSFSHIFAGGYAAGYYSYKWAEVLSSDAFEAFEEEGILNEETGKRFKETILESGGSVHPMALFKKFRGREPSIKALLRHSGISCST